MEDRERIARFISDFSDWDGVRQYIKEGWLHKADSLLQILKELGYRKSGKLLSEEEIKEIFLTHYTKQYGEEAATMLCDNLPDCNYGRAIAQAQLDKEGND